MHHVNNDTGRDRAGLVSLRPSADQLMAAVAELRIRFGDAVSTNRTVIEQHGHDESFHEAAEPDAVVFAESTQDVSDCVRICHTHRVPIIAFGAGTSLEGHVAAIHGGVSIDMTHMNQILRIEPDDLDCVVQAGALRTQLQSALAPHGLFFPVDPGADATIGGMAATGASGTTTVKYGAMRQLVLAMKVVLSDGRIISTARRARKTSAGYDLTGLFVGSEGTLGIITELTLRLFGIPERIGGAIVQFTSVERAVEAVTAIIQLGIDVARIELMDAEAVAAVNEYRDGELGLSTNSLLLLEFHGSPETVELAARECSEICQQFGGGDFDWTTDEAARRRLWSARHDAALAIRSRRPGGQMFITDVCVPISSLATCIAETRTEIERSGLYAPIIGHVGDGNFHVIAIIDPDRPSELEAIEEVNASLIRRALELDGSCTGEHGIGLGKMASLELELGPDAISVMGCIKSALDPLWLLNPGKV
ncbi:MAG: FAD-binding protein, partial [Actinomycetota bacterium]|nr:FAD-binding protein [Actinomycetota bacterium]